MPRQSRNCTRHKEKKKNNHLFYEIIIVCNLLIVNLFVILCSYSWKKTSLSLFYQYKHCEQAFTEVQIPMEETNATPYESTHNKTQEGTQKYIFTFLRSVDRVNDLVKGNIAIPTEDFPVL